MVLFIHIQLFTASMNKIYASIMVVFMINPLVNRIFWDSNKFEGHTDMVEPWYGTAYSIEKIDVSMIQVCCLVIYNYFLLVVI